MRALYFEQIPYDAEGRKDQNSEDNTIMGAGIYIGDVFKAILQHSAYDQILLPAPSQRVTDSLRESRLFAENAHRIKLVFEHELGMLKEMKHVILASPAVNFLKLIRIRRAINRPRTPITGVIHSINYSGQIEVMLPVIFSRLHSFDAMLCSSTAGAQAVKNYIRLIGDRIEQVGLGEFRPPIKTPVIPLGVDASQFADNGRSAREWLSIQEGVVILYFGRLSAASKADLYPLLIMHSELCRQHHNVYLVIAGDDTHFRMAKDLEDFASELGCRSNVRVVPNPTTAQKRELYAAGDVFVSLSDSLQETFGITLVEAMAAGLPIVASDWDGYKDLVAPGETGYLIPTLMPRYSSQVDNLYGSSNTKESDLLASTTVVDMAALKQALVKLIVDVEHRRELGLAARKRARDLYDWKAVIKCYEGLWEELAEEAAVAPLDLNRMGIAKWGYLDIFEHYPTAFLTNETRVAISDLGRQWRDKSQLISRITTSNKWFQPEELSSILDFLLAREDASLAEILAFHGSKTEGDSVRPLGHLCRLLKYGLVEKISRP